MPYYHVRISVDGERHDEVKTDLDSATLDRQILEPYRTAKPITINGKVLSLAIITRIRISASDEPSSEIIERLRIRDQNSQVAVLGGPGFQWRAAAAAEDVTDQFITGPPGTIEPSPGVALEPEEPVVDDSTHGGRRTVFVVAGRDNSAIAGLVALLRAVGLHVVEWGHAVAKTGLPNPYIGDVVEIGLRMADAAVVVLTPDDVVRLRDDLLSDDDGPDERDPRGQARPNVYYEAGIADALGRDRTVIVEVGKVKSFSDASGRHVVRYDGSASKRNVLVERLRIAGLDVDTSGEDWLSVGDIENALTAASSAFERTVTSQSPSVVDRSVVVSQIGALLDELETARGRSQHDDLSDLRDESLDFVFRSQALLDRFSPDSSHAREAEAVRDKPPHVRIPILAAALRALRSEESS